MSAVPSPEDTAVASSPHTNPPPHLASPSSPPARPPPKPQSLSKTAQRKLRKARKAENLHICQSFFRTKTCTRDACPYSHDIKEYLDSKPGRPQSPCPVYTQYGMCPSGFLCNWIDSHMTEDGELMVDAEKQAAHPFHPPLNTLPRDVQTQLRDKTYDFAAARPTPRPANPVDLTGKLVFPSLCTFGNLPYRKLVKEFGCDVTMSEMVMADPLVAGQTSEWALVKRDASEDVFGVQLCGGNAQVLRDAVALLEPMAVDFVELNCACPIDLVCNRGMGASLLEKPTRMAKFVQSIQTATNRPISVKLRTGVAEATIQTTILPHVSDWGCSFVQIHGRTRHQRYTKQADWAFLGETTRIAQCPVVGVGDIYTAQDVARAFATGVKAVGIARGALVKPWIFKEIKEQRSWDISSGERLEIIRKYATYGLAHWGSDSRGIATTREFLCHHLTFLSRYVPVHCCVARGVPESLTTRHEKDACYRDEMERLLASDKVSDWVRVTELFLGPAGKDFVFCPKHKSYAAAE